MGLSKLFRRWLYSCGLVTRSQYNDMVDRFIRSEGKNRKLRIKFAKERLVIRGALSNAVECIHEQEKSLNRANTRIGTLEAIGKSDYADGIDNIHNLLRLCLPHIQAENFLRSRIELELSGSRDSPKAT